MTVQKKRKRLLRIITAVVLVAALSIGIWFGTRGSGEPVNVYSFQYIGMTEFWGDMQESYGPVVTDKIQTEFLSDTQTVTEVKVKDGDSVKKGDVLFTFDTSLDALSLERKRLEVEKIKVQIDAAGERLQETREMVPYEPPKVTEPEEPDLGDELTEPYRISPLEGEDGKSYNGKSKETALICWLKDTTSITDKLLQELFETAQAYQADTPDEPEADGEQDKANASAVPEGLSFDLDSVDPSDREEQTYQVQGFFTCNGETVKPDNMTVGKEGYLIKDSYTYRDKTYWLKTARIKGEKEPLEDLRIPAYPQEAGEERDAWEATWEQGVEVEYVRQVTFAAQQMQDGRFVDFPEDNNLSLEANQNVVLNISAVIHDLPKEVSVTYTLSPQNRILSGAQNGNVYYLTGKPEKQTDAPERYTVTAKFEFRDNHGQTRAVEESFLFSVTVEEQSRTIIGEYYVVFKITEKNFLKGIPTVWHGAKVTAHEDGSFEVTPYDASAFADHTLPVKEEIEVDLPEIDPNAMYTAEQILEMQKQCYAIIKEQNEKLKMAESEYEIMQRELGDGNVYADIDGKVVSLLTEDEAREQKQPLIKVSGGGGFYIEGSVSELEKEKLKLGQEVTINDWNSGGTYTGEVISIGDFPSDNDNWNGMGNPTASYYPFKAFVGEEADLQSGSYVSMSYSTASAERGIYLEKAFVRTDKDGSYIFVRGADGKLEKRNVQVGKVLWGSYYEILSSLGEEDFLAFPYGKNVKQGAPTVESDLSTLYTY